MRHVTSRWLYYASIILLLIASGSDGSKCNCPDDELESKEWQCDDGGHSIRTDELCDGIAHCPDGSDETVMHCLNLTCPTYAFRCTYGACIQGSLRCNGHQDCIDGSDEMSYLCTSHDYQQIQLHWQGRCRSDTQLQCTSGDCINLEWLCDGSPQCSDGSDETLERCNFLHCPEYAFRCGYGGCVPGTARCDGVIHCADGSDELASVCGEGWNATRPLAPATVPSTSSVTPTSLPQPPLSPVPTSLRPPVGDDEDAEPGGCVVPQTLQHLLGVEGKKQHIVRRGERLPNGTRLKFFCTRGWQLEGSRKSRCRDGSWTKPLPHCNRNCSHVPLTRGISTQATCTFGGRKFDCAQSDLPAGVQAHIKCARGYQRSHNDTGDELMLTCDGDGEWDLSRFKCEPVCGQVPAATVSARKPWEVSIFRRSMRPTFEFACYGVIISPKIVLTAANCLRLSLTQNDNNKTLLEPIYYNVLEALTTDEYVQMENVLTRDIHNISEIILPKPNESVNAQIALLVLVHHFQLRPNLSPICFDDKMALPSAAILELPADAAGKIEVNLGNIISEKRAKDGASGRTTHYLSGVASARLDNGGAQLLRVHYYQQFIAEHLQRYYYLY